MFRSKLAAWACIAAIPAVAGDFDQLASTLKKNWPERTTWVVVCEVATSRAKVDALASVANGCKIALVDVKGPQDVGKAVAAVSSQHGQLLVLIPGDRVAGDGQAGATFLIQRLAAQKVPTVATSEAGARQGAVLAIGPGTGGKLLGNGKSAALVGLSLPEGVTPVS
ncbi:MAG: hypothetical protein HY823_03270 [Acidobacteria bacterium]|nr:hypothetical protein [Acidobacteriota bacterium]